MSKRLILAALLAAACLMSPTLSFAQCHTVLSNDELVLVSPYFYSDPAFLGQAFIGAFADPPLSGCFVGPDPVTPSDTIPPLALDFKGGPIGELVSDIGVIYFAHDTGDTTLNCLVAFETGFPCVVEGNARYIGNSVPFSLEGFNFDATPVLLVILPIAL